MERNTTERRLDLLKLEGNGLLNPEIVKELTAKYGCSRQTIYNDFNSRNKWQPQIEDMKTAVHALYNKHIQLYRKTMLAYLEAKDNKSRLFAISLLRSLNKDAFDMLQSSGRIEKTVAETLLDSDYDITFMWKEDEAETTT